MKKTPARGFTLIELLVVIAIIGLLSSVIMASLNTARVKARDAQRISNIKQLETAMELYYSDYGHYPEPGSNDNGYALSILSSYITPTYIASIAADPSGSTDYYVWGSSGASYGLWVYVEATNNWCLTGVNYNSAWWNASGLNSFCKF